MNNVHYKDKPPRTWLPTLRAFEIMFYPATATKGDRVRIKDTITHMVETNAIIRTES